MQDQPATDSMQPPRDAFISTPTSTAVESYYSTLLQLTRSSHLNVNSPDGRRLRLARERLTASHYEFTVVNKDMVAVTGTAT
jgi:hypothetical protein